MADNSANPVELERYGVLFVISSPSGAGKSTLSRMLLESDGDIAMSVSVTTRPARQGEVDGKDYHFVDDARFDTMVADNAFLEWAVVFGNRYGTLKAPVDALLAQGRDVLFDIDWQGAQQLHQRAGSQVVQLFILPPSLAALEERLRARATDSEEVICGRMDRARSEISHWDSYDYVVVNDEVRGCFEKVRTILAAERLKRSRQTGLIEFTRRLMHL